MKITGNEPAYPILGTELKKTSISNMPWGDVTSKGGLTIRQQFAMAAMQGLLSGNATYNGGTNNRELLVKDAIAHADALIAELNKIA